MTSDRPTDLFPISDQQLGQELGVLIAQQTSSNLPYSVIFNQLQDLLGDDTVLRGPLRDLLGRPAFQQLVGLKRHSVQVGSRDALLQDLGLTFSAGMVARLADFIDGCLDLPPRPVPPESQPSASSTTASSASPSTLPRPPQPPPPDDLANSPSAADGQPQGFTAAARKPATSLLIALVAMLGGALLVGLGWLVLGLRLQPGTNSAQSPKAAHVASQPQIAVQPTPTPIPPETSMPVGPPGAEAASLPLLTETPSEAQVQALLEAWLDAKAAILAGKDSRMPVEGLARASLVGRLEAERASDRARGETQTISTSITGLTIEERETNRIAATVILSYSNQRLNAKGDPEGEPTKLQLRNRYVFGREGGIWRVASFSKAP